MSTKKQRVAIADIRLDGGTQQRVTINDATVAEYAEDMKAGAKFPPLLLFFDGTDYWLADGFHRLAAIKRLPRRRKIDAEVREGTQRDAILHSVTVNAQHGLRRSNADKRNAVETLVKDPEWSGWSNSEIARRCSVSEYLVRNIRRDLTSIKSKLEPAPTDRTYVTKHGTPATMNTTRIGGTQTTDPALTPAPDPRPPPTAPPASTPPAAPPPAPAPLPFPLPLLAPAAPLYAEIEDIDLAQTLLSTLRAAHDERMANPDGYRPDGDWWVAMPRPLQLAYSQWACMDYPGLPPSPEALDGSGEPLPLTPLALKAPLPDLIDSEEIVTAEQFDISDSTSSQGTIGLGRCTAPTHLGGLFDGRYSGVSWIHVGGEYGDDDGTIWLWEAVTAEQWGEQRVVTIHDLLDEWRDNTRDPWDFRGLRLSGPWSGGLILGARRLRLHCPAGLRREGEPEIPADEHQWLDWRTYNGKSCDGIRQYTFLRLSGVTLARLWRRLRPRRFDWQDTPINRQILAVAVFAKSWFLQDSAPHQIESCRYLSRQQGS
ncbi:MAG: hypothetical protein ACI8RZ_003784 [Myxococcota bacterium]|jgi:hypothetical protein